LKLSSAHRRRVVRHLDCSGAARQSTTGDSHGQQSTPYQARRGRWQAWREEPGNPSKDQPGKQSHENGSKGKKDSTGNKW